VQRKVDVLGRHPAQFLDRPAVGGHAPSFGTIGAGVSQYLEFVGVINEVRQRRPSVELDAIDLLAGGDADSILDERQFGLRS
jgi:hypothetical protein